MSNVELSELIERSVKHIKSHKIQDNLGIRRKLIQSIREFMINEGFVEFETPVLSGRLQEYTAGQFIVRSEKGEEFHLVQSPQFFKQMLITSGVQKYFQFSHCFRDEPHDVSRTDRMREFTQFDLEMVASRVDEIQSIVERLFSHIFATIIGQKSSTFTNISYSDAISKHGTDRPKIRPHHDTENTFVWVNSFPLAAQDSSGSIRLVRHPMAKPKRTPKNIIDACDIKTHSFDLVFDGIEIGSGDLRIDKPYEQEKIAKLMNLETQQFQPLVELLKCGCPPHGGIGIGLDRLAMMACEVDDIADVIAFPDWFGCMHRE